LSTASHVMIAVQTPMQKIGTTIRGTTLPCIRMK
jgi:hypothetical protein